MAAQHRLYSIGHSNQSLDQLLGLLDEFGIKAVADIRRFPGSRVHPQFNRENLAASLAARGIEYHWFEDLGGRRHGAATASPNTGLELPAFRAYADYMATDPFRAAAARLIALGDRMPTAYMCAEKLFWKCHRRILSDWLVANKVEVVHIIDTATSKSHTLSNEAVATPDGSVTYPPRQGRLW